MSARKSKLMAQRASDMRKIAEQSHTRVGRHVASKLADEYDEQAAEEEAAARDDKK